MSLFKIQEHNIPTSYIREYARSLADQNNDDLRQSVKQYTPLDNLSPQPGDVTIIAGHANGFPKELYEPLWDELYHTLKAQDVRIRHIFIADVFNQGQSGILNEALLGNDPAWFDMPRDYLIMINNFRNEIKQPIIGIGHSMGGVNLINLSNMHPRLFTALALIDPPLQRQQPPVGTASVAHASVNRRDIWPSRSAAEASFKKSKFYSRWDPRVLERFVKHGLRDLPTHIFPDKKSTSGEPEVTLATTKHQEVLSFLRAGLASGDKPAPYEQPGLPKHITHPDVDETVGPGQAYYRPELAFSFKRLQFLRPSILWVFADQSELSSEALMADKLAATGIGIGGNGGVKAGRVKSVVMKGAGHLVPMEDVKGVALHLSNFIVPELKRYAEETAAVQADWDRVPMEKRSLMSDGFIEGLTGKKPSKM